MKKALALFLALVLCFGMIPAGTIVMADEASTEVTVPSFEGSGVTGANWAYKWNTVEFPTPLDLSGSDGTLVLTFTLPTKADLHIFPFRIYLNGKTLEFKYHQTTPAATIEQTIVLEDYGITDEDLKNVTGYFVQLSHGGTANLDYTFKLEAPRAPISYSFEGSVVTGANWAYKAFSSTFDTPIDLSGSDGTLVITHTLSATADLHIKPFEIYINGKTLSFELNELLSGTRTQTIVLDDYGITDEDLKNVTGYKVNSSHGGAANLDYTFKVEAPRAPITPSFEGSGVTGANWNYKWNEVKFPTPLDLSGSDGTLVLTFTLPTKADLHIYPFRIYLNGKTLEFNYHQTTPAATIEQTIVLADYGITDEDLKNVAGYFVQLSHGGTANLDYTFKLEAPRANIKPTTPSFEGSGVTGASWAYKAFSSNFDTPIDLSGSNGTLVLTHTLPTKTDLHLNPFVIYINGKSLEFTHYQSTPAATIEQTIVLADYGITDEDLKNVTGYKVNSSHGAAGNLDYTFKVEAPRASVAATSFDGSIDIPDGYTFGEGWLTKTIYFDKPLDMSGGYGALVLEHKASIENFGLKLNIKTADGTSFWMPVRLQTNITSGSKVTVNLADIGLTDEMLKNVIGYTISVAENNGTECAYSFTLSAPKLPEGSAEQLVYVRKLLLNGVNNLAADFNGDGVLDIRDLVNLKKKSLIISLGSFEQKEFYLSTFVSADGGEYENFVNALKLCKEAGINTIEDYVTVHATDCEELGLNMIYNLGRERGSDYTEQELYNTMWNNRNNKSIIGYYTWDEVGADSFSAAAAKNAFVKKHDPARLAYSILFPSYGSVTWDTDYRYDEYVKDYLDIVNPEVLAFDYYPMNAHNLTTSNVKDVMKCDWWRDMGIMRKYANEYNKPFWYYVESVDIESGLVGDLTQEQIALELYAGLAYGADSLSYYKVSGYLYSKNGMTKTDRFEAGKALNTKIVNIGNLLLNRNSEKIYHTGFGYTQSYYNNLYYLDSLSSSDLISSAPDDLIISQFAGDNGQKYLLLVNKNYVSPASGTLNLKSEKAVSQFDADTNTINALGNTSSISLNIPAGSGVVYVIG